jgi:ankyrin repeat protein
MLLIKSGANINSQNNKGETSLHSVILSKQQDRIKILKLLMKNNANLNIKDKNGMTPLKLGIVKSKIKFLHSL